LSAQFRKQIERLLSILQGKADTVVPHINKHFRSFDLNAIDGGGQKDMLSVSQQRADRLATKLRELGIDPDQMSPAQ